MKKHYRQGDVLLVQVSCVPVGSVEEACKERIVLAYGEVTGHAHAVPAAAATYYLHGATNYLKVESPTALVHEEHSRIPLEPGVYKVVRQREYTFTGMREVED